MSELCKLLIVFGPFLFVIGLMWMFGAFKEWPNRGHKEHDDA